MGIYTNLRDYFIYVPNHFPSEISSIARLLMFRSEILQGDAEQYERPYLERNSTYLDELSAW